MYTLAFEERVSVLSSTAKFIQPANNHPKVATVVHFLLIVQIFLILHLAAMDQHLACFGPTAECRYFALVTKDGRLRVWETASGRLKQEYTEQNHLSNHYTCMVWAGESSRAPKRPEKKKRKVAPDSAELGTILLGTGSGDIVVWNLKEGKVSLTISAYQNQQPVSSLALTADGSTVYATSTANCLAKRFDVRTGKFVAEVDVGKDGAERIAVDEEEKYFASGNATIKMWEPSSMTPIADLVGHARKISHLQFTADGKYLLSTATLDRFPALWNCQSAIVQRGEGEVLSDRSAVDARQTFAMDTPPVCSDIMCGEGSDIYHLLAVSDSGRLNVWSWDAVATEKKIAKKLKKRKKRKYEKEKIIPARQAEGVTDPSTIIISARFCTANGKREIFTAYGSLAGPTFEKVPYLAGDTKEIMAKVPIGVTAEKTASCLIHHSQSVDASKGMSNQNSGAHVAGMAENGAASWPTDRTIVTDEDSDDNDDATLADRVDLLSKQLEGHVDSDVDDDTNHASAMRSAAARAADIASTVEDESISMNVPRARSLVKILEQALKVSDDALLEHCLSTSDENIIRETVEGLAHVCVAQFLTRVISKFESRPARAATLCLWIKSVVEKHAGYLTSSPDAVSALGSLHSTVDTRLGVFKRLLKLSGRLELILSQISNRHPNYGSATTKRPRREFEDNGLVDDESEDDSEDLSESDESDDSHGKMDVVKEGSKNTSSSSSSGEEEQDGVSGAFTAAKIRRAVREVPRRSSRR